MKFSQTRLRLLPILLLTLVLSGCVVPEALIVKPPTDTPTTPASNAPTSTPTQNSANLAAAIAHASLETDYIAFTDWSMLKRTAGFTDLTSANTLDERLEFIMPLSIKSQAIASNFGLSHYVSHAETWGWDSTDLIWESMLTTDGPPIYVLRFRDDFDFAPVFARLDERGYSTDLHDGVTLYHHAMDFNADWMGSTEFAILNIAFLEAENIFILSSSPDSVTTLLDDMAQGATLASRPDITSVAATLGNVGAAILSPLGCQPLDVAPLLDISPEARQKILGDLDKSGISGLYTTFGFGYTVQERDGESIPVGLFVHYYPIPEQAEADLAPRQLVAETANSLLINAPYAELFEVLDAQVVDDEATNGANLILTLHAHERAPQLFIRMIYSRDLLFSTCGTS